MRSQGRPRGRRCGSIQLGGRNSGRPSRKRTVQPAWWTSRWHTLHNRTQLARAVSPPSCHGWMWWTSHQLGGRPQRAQPPSRAITARRRPSGTTRVARPTSSGRPWPSSTIGMTAASQAAMRRASGVKPAAEVEHRRSAAVFQVVEPDGDGEDGAPAAGRGHVGVLEHIPAGIGECVGLPLRRRAVVLGGARLRLCVEEGRDGVEHRGVVEPADQPPATADPVGAQVQLVDREHRSSSSGAGPSASKASISCAPRAASSAGVHSRHHAASCPSAPAHTSGVSRSAAVVSSSRATISTCRRLASPASNTVAVAASRGGSGAPSSPIRGRTRGAAARRRRASARSQPSKIAECGGGGAVAAVGEDAAPFDLGQYADQQLVDAPGRGFAQGQQREQVSVAGARSGHLGEPGQRRVDALGDLADRAVGHEPSLSDDMFEFWPAALTDANFRTGRRESPSVPGSAGDR